jgi:hypothetical protein
MDMAETTGTTDLQRMIKELRERLRAEATELAAAPAPGPAERTEAAPPVPVAPPGERPLSDAEVLEVESVQRRQLHDALLYGRSGAATAAAGRGRGLWAGLAVAIAIALCVGLTAMVQATMAHGGAH